MSETPLVSICCITYNHASFIRQCLDGFLMQKTSFPFEILIHDDASTDGTADIIREYQKKYPDIIKPILQKENQFSKGIMVGAEYNYPRACGKYIAVCEGDDYWTDPEKLQIQFDYMEKHPECSLCYHDLMMLKDGNFSNTVFCNEPEFDFYYSSGKLPHCTTCTLFFRNIDHSRKLCDVLRNGKKRIKGGDVFIMGVMSHFGALHWMPRIMAVYRIHSGGITKNKDWINDKLTWITHWLYFYEIVPEAYAAVKKNLHRQIKDEFFKLLCLKKNRTWDIIQKIYCFKGWKCVIYWYGTAFFSSIIRFPSVLIKKIFGIKPVDPGHNF